jgi:hypothetical protein
MIIYRLLLAVPQIAYLYVDEFGTYYDTPPADSYIVDSPDQEQALENVRAYRNELLLGSDYTQLPDAPFTPAQVVQWREYRQALRDYPQQINVELWTAPPWPVAPQ